MVTAGAIVTPINLETIDCSNQSSGPSFPVEGRLQIFWPAWDLNGMDPWVLQVTDTNPLLCNPPPLGLPLQFPSYQKDSSRFLALRESIESMKIKMTIEKVESTRGFYSRLLVVPKSNGTWRPVIDLSPFNKYVHKTKFHLETPRTVLQAL